MDDQVDLDHNQLDDESDKRKQAASAVYNRLAALYSTPQNFTAKAKCIGMPLKYFTITQRGDVPTSDDDHISRENLKKGLAVCIGCPLMYNGECYNEAENVDLRWTIRGGEIPLMWDQNRDRIKRSGRPKKTSRDICVNGHDVSQPEQRRPNGACKICDLGNKRRRYQEDKARKGQRAATSGLECRNGHDLTLPDSQYANGRCVTCNRINSAKWNAVNKERRIEARNARLAASRADGVE